MIKVFVTGASGFVGRRLTNAVNTKKTSLRVLSRSNQPGIETVICDLQSRDMPDDNPDGDIAIEFTGLRPGEKLYEELLVDDNITKTENKLILRANEEMIDWDKLKPTFNELEEASVNAEHEKIRKLLKRIVPQFKPQSNIVDLMYKK